MSAFDTLAPTYDADFTASPIARHLRARVHARLDVLTQPGQAALELGCGTGEDALHLAQGGVHITATDASTAMLAIARQKLAPFPHAHTVHLDLQALGAECKVQSATDSVPGSEFDVQIAPNLELRTLNSELNTHYASHITHHFFFAYANFGVLNCLSDWRPLAAWLAERVVSGGHVAFGVMSPFCVWETLWHGAHGDWRTATRRWRRGGAEFKVQSSQFSVLSPEYDQVSGIRYQPDKSTEYKVQSKEPRTTNSELGTGNSSLIFYPTIPHLTRDFAPWFHRTHVETLGVFLPPSDVYGAVEKRPRLLKTLFWLDERIGRARWLALAADHYWIEFKRT
jgi:SAM-dependent methyltransferase